MRRAVLRGRPSPFYGGRVYALGAMALTKAWKDRYGSGTQYANTAPPDPETGIEPGGTPIDAAGLRDLEQRALAEITANSGVAAFVLIEDPTTGYPTRPSTGSSTWIGWSDPTSLMHEYDRFILVPNPGA